MQLSLDRHGAELVPNLITADRLAELEAILSVRRRAAGVRIRGDAKLDGWISGVTSLRQLMHSLLGAAARPVRAVLFDKSDSANWALGWHQDRTIAVRERREVDGYANWTLKARMPHVEPPFALLERMVTARIHLDEVGPENGPLLIIPGSHRLGRLLEEEIGRVVADGNIFACSAIRGDVWLYSTPIVHASETARRPTARRVLQIDFSAETLPDGLQWAGIGT